MRNPQLSTTVSHDLFQQVEQLAKKDNRSLSEMVSLLLQQAVKDRLRKRKNAAKDL